MQNRLLDLQITESTPDLPVTLNEVKAWGIVDFTDDDTLLTALITQSRKAIERKLNISLVPKVIVATLDLYSEKQLPRGPHKAITTVKRRDGSNTDNTPKYIDLNLGADYTTDGELFKRILIPVGGRFKITYTAGYGNADMALPEDIKNGLMQEIIFRYRNRGDSAEVAGVSEGAMNYLQNHISYAWL